jgi:hypothetical protein
VLIGGVLLALASVLALLWLGGEAHYGNCLQAAEANYPVTYQQGNEKGKGYLGMEAIPPKWVYLAGNEQERADAISGCSRWP